MSNIVFTVSPQADRFLDKLPDVGFARLRVNIRHLDLRRVRLNVGALIRSLAGRKNDTPL